MSRTLTLVTTQAPPSLVAFASSLVAKATRGGLTAATSPVALAGGGRQIAVGSSAPAGTHTVVTRGAQRGLYDTAATTLVRGVWGNAEGFERSAIAASEALDTFASVGAPALGEKAALVAAIRKSLPTLEAEATRLGVSAVTLVIKPTRKYAVLKGVVVEALNEAIAGSAVVKSANVVSTAQASNQLVLFPESMPLVFLADLPLCATVELAFAGVSGGAAQVFYGDVANVVGGYSAKSVARAVASVLAGDGMTTEATALEKVLETAHREAAILAALK